MNQKQFVSGTVDQLEQNGDARAYVITVMNDNEDINAGLRGNIADLLYIEITNIFDIVQRLEADPAERERLLVEFGETCIKAAHQRRLKARTYHHDETVDPMAASIINTISPTRHNRS